PLVIVRLTRLPALNCAWIGTLKLPTSPPLTLIENAGVPMGQAVLSVPVLMLMLPIGPLYAEPTRLVMNVTLPSLLTVRVPFEESVALDHPKVWLSEGAPM